MIKKQKFRTSHIRNHFTEVTLLLFTWVIFIQRKHIFWNSFPANCEEISVILLDVHIKFVIEVQQIASLFSYYAFYFVVS